MGAKLFEIICCDSVAILIWVCEYGYMVRRMAPSACRDFHMNDLQERFLRFDAFLGLGFGLIDSARLISSKGSHCGFVSYFSFGFTE